MRRVGEVGIGIERATAKNGGVGGEGSAGSAGQCIEGIVVVAVGVSRAQ